MQISCEKCSATYELDERMLSPAGTPVQCTRCHQVFLARLAGAELPAAELDIPIEMDAEPTQVSHIPVPDLSPGGNLPPSALEPSRVTQIYGRIAPAPSSAPRPGPAAVTAPALSVAPPPPPPPLPKPKPPPLVSVKAMDVTASMKMSRDRATTVELPALDPLSVKDPLARLGAPTELSIPRSRARVFSATVFFGIGMAVILAAGGGLYLLRRKTGLSSAAYDRDHQAWALLRSDDAIARAEARRTLEKGIGQYPEVLRLRFDLLSVLAIDLDESKWEDSHLKEESSRLAREISELQEARTPMDWQVRANALDAELSELKIRQQPAADRARMLAFEAERLFAQLTASVVQADSLPSQDVAAWNRAQALYHGVRGEESAVALAHAYRHRTPPEGQDGWGEVALAEFAVNAATPGTSRRQAVENLWSYRAKDSNFMRIQVLSGRLALQEGDLPLAQKALEAVVALNPKHRFAAEVLAVAHETAALEASEPER